MPRKIVRSSEPLWSLRSWDGATQWTVEAKLVLLKVAWLNKNAKSMWKAVHNNLVDMGMPETSHHHVAGVYNKLKAKSLQLKKQKESGRIKQLPKLYAKTIEHLDKMQASTKRYVPHKEVEVKEEPAEYILESDDDDENDASNNENQKRGRNRVSNDIRKNPTVLLKKLPSNAISRSNVDHNSNDTKRTTANHHCDMPTTSKTIKQEPVEAMEETRSPAELKYWEKMQELAEHNVQLMLAKRENEAERMEFDRDLYQKNMILADLKIKTQNLTIGELKQAMTTNKSM